MRVTVEKSNMCGMVKAQPSKSMAHRLLICAALSGCICKIDNLAYSDDILATINCLNALGISCEKFDNYVIVYGKKVNEFKASSPLMCNECGSTLRFFIPLALLLNQEVMFLGTKKLFSRPLTLYDDLCSKHNFTFKKEESSLLIKGQLLPGEYNIAGNVSSQFISGMLFALSAIKGKSVINITTTLESRSYVNLTIAALNEFGINAYFENDKKIVVTGGTYTPKNVVVEGDYSNASFLDALNYLGNSVNVLGLDAKSLQGDRVYKEYFEKLKNENAVLDINDCPDLAPILFVIAVLFNGATFLGTNRLKIKESDRATAMAEELAKFGANILIGDNQVTITKTELYAPKTAIYGHDDHRIVMALTILLTKFGGEIFGAEAINKSYPNFFSDLLALNCELSIYDNN